MARKKFETLEQYAENSIKIVKKEAKTFERVPPYSLTLNSHNAIYNQTSLSEKSPGLFGAGRQPIRHGTYSIHLYCEESSRFFVIYAVFSNTDETFKEIFMKMANSLQCH